MKEEIRYEVVKDDSSHAYYIPCDKANDWPCNDEDFEDFIIPEWAHAINGILTFASPKVL